MFCPKCGAENPDEAKFCSKCGAENKLRRKILPELRSASIGGMNKGKVYSSS